MRLAFFVASGVESQDCLTVIRLAETALASGHDVSIFLMADGVFLASRLARLSARGARLVRCSHNALQRGLPPLPGVEEGSQLDWAHMLAEADRVVNFG